MSEDGGLPAGAACVVIGGGVGGASVAYHLAALGLSDVVVLEQHDLGDGTTWHSAGFVGQLSTQHAQPLEQLRILVAERRDVESA